MTYNFYCDPGHGWLAVKRSELEALDLTDKISRYSYQKGDTVYLEEDGDASAFIEAAKAAGREISFNEIEHAGQSWIRSLERYSAGQVKEVKAADLMESLGIY